MNEQNDVYVCPRCGKKGMVNGIMPLLDNVRYDVVGCECGVQWRVYYKFENPKTEVVYVPADEGADEPKPEDEQAQGE